MKKNSVGPMVEDGVKATDSAEGSVVEILLEWSVAEMPTKCV